MIEQSATIKHLVVFAALALISYAVYEYTVAEPASINFEPFTKGYALYDGQIQMTDDQGQIYSIINSPKVIHYANSKITEVKKPELSFFYPDVKWLMNAEIATVNADQSIIHFPKDVFIVNNQSPSLSVKTSDLEVFPQQQKAMSKSPIYIEQSDILISGLGSVIDLNKQQIEILDETHAEF